MVVRHMELVTIELEAIGPSLSIAGIGSLHTRLRSKDAPRLSDAGPIRTTPVLSSLERMNKVIGPCSQAVNSWTTTSLL
jgi:hypothetical protein